jgi:hypothetical protein
MVAPTWITPGCVQSLENKKRFHTAWARSRRAGRRVCTENLDSDVMVMKSTKDRVRANDTGSLNRA